MDTAKSSTFNYMGYAYTNLNPIPFYLEEQASFKLVTLATKKRVLITSLNENGGVFNFIKQVEQQHSSEISQKWDKVEIFTEVEAIVFFNTEKEEIIANQLKDETYGGKLYITIPRLVSKDKITWLKPTVTQVQICSSKHTCMF